MLPEGEYWKYLRKSRADMEAEARGEGETLSKHDKALNQFAKKNNLLVTRVYKEIVSGESIFHRPQMTQMLQQMVENPPKGILVMDYDRLGRGDKIDQGVIEKTFKECNTLIVTPSETIDLNSESGEFSAEVRGFLARMELKQSTKRMQGGRVRSVESGNYIATRPPFGYLIHKDEIGRTLIPHPDQATIVKLVFDLYTNENIGTNKIANQLNAMGYRSYTGKMWTPPSVNIILKNEHYTGLVIWGKKEQKKSREIGKRRDTRTRPANEWIKAKGRHEPLVSEEVFRKAQEILEGKYHVPYQLENGITNPLAGLIKCGLCGTSMVLRPYVGQKPHLMCYNRFCKNKSSRFEFVESRLLEALQTWLKDYKAQWGKYKRTKKNNESDSKESILKNLTRELTDLEGQKEKLHDFLERGIYDEDTYLERSRSLAERIEQTKKYIFRAQKELNEAHEQIQAQKDVIPHAEHVLKMYSKRKDPAKKNSLLKSILVYADYRKEPHQRNDQFTLTLHPRLDKNR